MREQSDGNNSTLQTENSDANLVTFQSVEELNYVRDQLVVERSRFEEHIWVGASDLQTENVWLWITGGQVSSRLWSQGEPNNQGK